MLSVTDQHQIENVVREAEAGTGTDISVTVVPVSDSFFGYVLLDNLFLAGFLDWWLYSLRHVPLTCLLSVIAFAVLLAFVPFYRRLVIPLLPKRVRHHHAARSAINAFHELEHKRDDEKPVVMLYVSLAEHYVHVLHSRSLKGRLTEKEWQGIVKSFAKTMKKSGLKGACLQAVGNLRTALSN